MTFAFFASDAGFDFAALPHPDDLAPPPAVPAWPGMPPMVDLGLWPALVPHMETISVSALPHPDDLAPPPTAPAWPGNPPAVDFGAWPALAAQEMTAPASVDPWW